MILDYGYKGRVEALRFFSFEDSGQLNGIFVRDVCTQEFSFLHFSFLCNFEKSRLSFVLRVCLASYVCDVSRASSPFQILVLVSSVCHTGLWCAVVLFDIPFSQVLNTVKECLQNFFVPFYRALFIEINEDGIDIPLWFPDCATVEIFTH